MGLGDAGVSIKIKKLVSAYMGRQKAYCDSFKNNNLNKLIEHIENNVYRNGKAKKSNTFKNSDKKDFLNGDFNFPIFKIK